MPKNQVHASARHPHKLRLRVLMSYHYYGKIDLDHLIGELFGEPYPDVFVDSGAFSVYSLGATISLTDYAAWVKRYRHWISAYANLDDKRSAETTLANQHRLEDLGLQPLPVYHHGAPARYLEHYLEHYPYLCLGGTAGSANKSLMPYYIHCHRLARQAGTVLHGFGNANWQSISALPWYSVDSTGWNMGYRYGQLSLFDQRQGRWTKIGVGDVAGIHRHIGLLRQYELDPVDLANRDFYHHAKIVRASAMSVLRSEEWHHRTHGPVAHPDGTREPGLRSYIADSNGDHYLEVNRVPPAGRMRQGVGSLARVIAAHRR